MHNAPNWNSFAHLYTYRKAAHSHYTRNLTNFNRDTRTCNWQLGHFHTFNRSDFDFSRFPIALSRKRTKEKRDRSRANRRSPSFPGIVARSLLRANSAENCRSLVSRLTGAARKWEASRMCSLYSIEMYWRNLQVWEDLLSYWERTVVLRLAFSDWNFSGIWYHLIEWYAVKIVKTCGKL